jgi:acylphosphatase
MADVTRVVRVRVKGLVQGVNYRAWTADLANGLRLTGWVRNRADGTVEALFAGAGADVEAMLERCREGPAAARVKEVVIEAEGGEPPDGFAIRPTV